jgi:cytoskeletal protein RodZ
MVCFILILFIIKDDYYFVFRYFKYTKPPKRSVNNAKKLFTVLGTLVAITVGAIILVILWYRLKTIFKRKQKKKKIIDQQKHLSSPSNNNISTINNHSTAPRYASSDMLSSIHNTQLAGSKSQSQALIASATPPPTVYKNADALANDSIHSFIDDEHQQQQQEPQEPQQENLTNENDKTAEIQAVTQC